MSLTRETSTAFLPPPPLLFFFLPQPVAPRASTPINRTAIAHVIRFLLTKPPPDRTLRRPRRAPAGTRAPRAATRRAPGPAGRGTARRRGRSPPPSRTRPGAAGAARCRAA